jgi:hypothetical protein
MTNTAYSFTDVNLTLQDPLVGQTVIDGQGEGSIAFSFADDRAQQSIGADGSVMTSKIKSSRGTITLTLQQTSSKHKWLLNWANAVDSASASQYRGMSLTCNEKFDNGTNTTATGIVPQKIPDHTNEQAGGNIVWVLMSDNMSET